MVNTEILEITANAPVFQLTWSINNICTNHCRYCPSTLHSGKNHHYEWQHAERFALALMDRHEHIQLAIAGGEPTVSPWLKDLINLFLSRGHEVGVTSNGVRAAQYWTDCRPDYVCLSYHAEYADHNWLVNAVKTHQLIPHTTARIMMDPLRWDQCVRAFNTLKSSHLGVEAVRILDWGGNSQRVHYTEEQLAWLDRTPNQRPSPFAHTKIDYSATVHYLDGRTEYASGPWANQLISQNGHYFTGWQCDIGVNSLFVQYDGSYRRGNCSQGGYVGRLNDPVLKWPTESVICELNFCHCTTDILTPKRLIPIYPK
jgi:organic radical activating enzyme